MANIINVSEGQAEYVIPYNCESVRYDLFLGLWPLTISKAVLVLAKITYTKNVSSMGFLPSFIAICSGSPGCANGGTCISPERCRCMPGWQGAKCRTGMYCVRYRLQC